MLRALHIENIAVIRCLDVDFHTGFSALTGETGAGKSLLIDSLNFLLGNRVPRDLIRTGENHAIVSAVFEELSPSVMSLLDDLGFPSEDGTLMLQRTMNTEGRSQCRLNGQTVTQAVLKKISGALISIHGQSESQKLLQKAYHLDLLDASVKPERELAAYRKVYRDYCDVRRRLSEQSQDESEKLRLREMLQYQIEDIDSLKLREGEEEATERELDRLHNLEKINHETRLAHHLLVGSEKGAAIDLIRRARNAIASVGGVMDGADELAARLDAAESEILDVAETVIGYADDDREDPTARIDRLESRLDAISKLKRKYGGSIAEILAFREKAAERLEALDLSGERRAELEKQCRLLKKQAETLAAILHEKRKTGSETVRKQVTETLRFLDMPKVRFEIAVAPCELNENGADDVEFLIASNPGEPLLPMIRIASGGELSRIMLALRSVLNDRDGAETVIFDEIDSGVSGKTSRKIGIKLHDTARNVQVLCVTHSAQIASLADVHYRVSKAEQAGRAETDVTELNETERVEEIARILGGIEITDVQRAAAKEMIEEYREAGK